MDVRLSVIRKALFYVKCSNDNNIIRKNSVYLSLIITNLFVNENKDSFNGRFNGFFYGHKCASKY